MNVFVLITISTSVLLAQPVPKPPTGKAAIRAKLDSVVLPELCALDGFSLGEVVELLIKVAAKVDPATTHINFLVVPSKFVGLKKPEEGPAIDPNTGLPILGKPSSSFDSWGPDAVKMQGLVRPLRAITLGQALEIITRFADMPTKFSVEDYGVVIESALIQPEILNLQTELEKFKKRIDGIEAENERLRKLLAERQSLPLRKP